MTVLWPNNKELTKQSGVQHYARLSGWTWTIVGITFVAGLGIGKLFSWKQVSLIYQFDRLRSKIQKRRMKRVTSNVNLL